MLDKPNLKKQIADAFRTNLPSPNAMQESEIDTLAGALANTVDNYVRSLVITYTAGLTSPSGPVTGTFQFTLS